MLSVLLAVYLVEILGSSSTVSNGGNVAYTWGKSFPQSCSCAENGGSATSCSYFKCNCICDVTAGKCDYNCCCDPDCSSDQIARFEDLGVCATEGAADSIQFCYSSDYLAKINPHTPMSGGQTSASSSVQQALCIEKKNVESRIDYFTDSSLVGASVFQTSKGKKSYDYAFTGSVESSITASVMDSFYDQNDTIPAYLLSGSDIVPFDGDRFMRLPVADFSGKCNDDNFVHFEVGVDSNTCIRDLGVSNTVSDIYSADEILSIVSNQCSQGVSVARFISDLRYGINADVGFGTNTATSVNTDRVELNSITFVDYVSGASQTLSVSTWFDSSASNNPTCKTAFFSTYAAYQASGCFSSGSTIDSAWAGGVCLGVVKDITYTIKHDQSTSVSLTHILADVVITDVPVVLDSTLVDVTGVDSGITSVVQSFGVEFTDSHDGTGVVTNNNAGNVVNRTRSGNPGYIMGSNVLFGELTSGLIVEFVDGLQITYPKLDSSSLSSCTTSSNVADLLGYSVPFGYDISTGCALYLNRTQLENICSGITSEYVDAGNNNIPYYLTFNDGYVGIYGNADTLDKNQWIEMTQSTASSNTYTGTPTWNDANSVCTGFANGLNIKFLVAYSGEKSNSQNKIVSVMYEYTTSPWRMSTSVLNTEDVQAFPMTITVSFVFKLHQDLVGYNPPAPPLLFEVPYDVFYPFVRNSAAVYEPAMSILRKFGFLQSQRILTYICGWLLVGVVGIIASN